MFLTAQFCSKPSCIVDNLNSLFGVYCECALSATVRHSMIPTQLLVSLDKAAMQIK